MKRFLLIILALTMLISLSAQKNIDDLLFGEEQTEEVPAKDEKLSTSANDDFIRINFQKKDARRAMLYSALLPGLGQFYADKSALSTWVFPIVEAGLIGGIIYFNISGDKKTEDFEYYATGETINQTFNYTVNGVDYSYQYEGPRY